LSQTDFCRLRTADFASTSGGAWLSRAPGSTFLTDVIGKTLLELPQLRPMLDFVEKPGAPRRLGTDEPEALLASLGWTVTAHDLGTFAAEVGRWPWPIFPRSVPGVPRSFLVEETRPPDGD